MTRPPDLRRLSEARKDALIRDLWAVVQERDALIADLCKRVSELESKLGGPPKTPDNSSMPPSQRQKVNTPPGKARAGNKRGKGHGRGGRGLHHDPDQRVAARVTTCPHCAAALGGSEQTLHALYDKGAVQEDIENDRGSHAEHHHGRVILPQRVRSAPLRYESIDGILREFAKKFNKNCCITHGIIYEFSLILLKSGVIWLIK